MKLNIPELNQAIELKSLPNEYSGRCYNITIDTIAYYI